MVPLKLAIIGGGPSAFYVASRILKLSPSRTTRVHIFDRLWSPYGLVRYGVAPDHPEVKNCTHKFDATFTDHRLRFFGNVNIGDTVSPIKQAVQIPLASIFKNYSHLVFATGCTLPTLHSALPPSTHCIPAISLVHWYTQHPNAPPAPPLDQISHVSLIGNGNVSLDIARMLLTNADDLKKYDVPLPVLDVLSKSSVKHISIFGRRGPLEAAFTMKELRELINLTGTSMVPIDPEILKVPSENTSLTRQQSRVLQLLAKGSKNAPGTTAKTWSLDFHRSPTGLALPNSTHRSPAQLSLAHTIVDPRTLRAVPSGDSSTIATDLVITSLGFHGEPAASYYDPGLGHLRTLSGRIVTPSGHILKNAYASGWAATGAKGVLAATMINAYDTAQTIVNDYEGTEDKDEAAVKEAILNPNPILDEPPLEVQEGISQGHVIEFDDWKTIDEEEVKRGMVIGKERERMQWEEAIAFLSANR